MKKVFKYFGILLIMMSSFYYTDKIALIVQKNNPIMKQINESKKEKNIKSVNAIIDNDKIIPGKNGLEINENKSFGIMKSFGAYDSYYLVYDQKKPNISIDNYKDKIIKSGNTIDRNVSFVLEYNDSLISFFAKNKIKASILIDKENIKKVNYMELINNDFNKYNDVELQLNKYSKNKNICYLNDRTYYDFCKKRNKYLVSTDYVFSNDNVFEIKNNIKNGTIIYVKNNTSIDNLKVLLNQIKFKGLNIVYLSELISEENKDL